MDLIIRHVESMAEYKELEELKGKSQVGNGEIQDIYNKFLRAYMFEDNQNELIAKITEKF